MRRLLLVLALVAVGCSDDADTTAAPSTTTTTVAPTTTTVPGSIEVTRVCGPTDGPAVTVEVTGVDARTVDLELQADGPPFVVVPYHADRTSIAAEAGLGGLVTVARIREADGGRVLAADRTFDEDYGGGCG